MQDQQCACWYSLKPELIRHRHHLLSIEITFKRAASCLQGKMGGEAKQCGTLKAKFSPVRLNIMGFHYLTGKETHWLEILLTQLTAEDLPRKQNIQINKIDLFVCRVVNNSEWKPNQQPTGWGCKNRTCWCCIRTRQQSFTSLIWHRDNIN